MRRCAALRADLHRGLTRIRSVEKNHESIKSTRIWCVLDVIIFFREIRKIRVQNITILRLIGQGVFFCVSFFLLQELKSFSLQWCWHIADVRCRGWDADGDACIHRCRQHGAAQGVAPTPMKFFLLLIDNSCKIKKKRVWMTNSIGRWTRKIPSTWAQDIAPTATSADISRMAADAAR